MTLYEYLKLKNEEVVVWDNTYDIEVYFEGLLSDPNACDATTELSKKLHVVQIAPNGVVVDMYDLIDRNMENITNAELFNSNVTDTEDVMDNIESIIAGYTTEKWLNRFVNTLVA